MRPNVVVIMADQLRWDALGTHTPAINALIEESVLFGRAYCASPICVPARGSFFTGLYPNRTGSLMNPWDPIDSHHGNVRAGTANLYTLFESEWDSRHVGKQHLYTEEGMEERADSLTTWNLLQSAYPAFLQERGLRRPGGPAFKGIVPEMVGGRLTRMKRYSIPTTGVYEGGFDGFTDGFIAHSAVDAIRARDRTKPLLLNAMFVAPHPPYDVPEPFYSLIEDVELPESVGRWYDDQSPLQLYNLPGAIGVRYSRADWHEVWRVYLGLVALLDHAVDLIVRELKAASLYDDSLVVFCADHGEMLGSHMLYQKMCMYEPSALTPIAMKLPKAAGIEPHQSDELVGAIDVFPTVCEVAGVPIPEDIDGQSLLPLIRGEASGRDQFFIQFDGNGARGNFQRAMVRADHKLIVDIFKDETYLELYDIRHDPEESRNLAFESEHRSLMESMVGALIGHMRSTDDLLSLDEGLVSRFLREYEPLRRSPAG